jgi:hypothetical protein
VTGTVKARMIGGPVARQSGEVVAPAPDWLYFGREGGFCYRLDPHATGRKGAVTYRYDRDATRAKLKHLGVPLDLVSLAVDDDDYARIMSADGITQRPEIAGAEVQVTVECWPAEWRAIVNGETYDVKTRDAIDPEDHDAISGWAEEVGRDYIAAHKEPEEAPA